MTDKLETKPADDGGDEKPDHTEADAAAKASGKIHTAPEGSPTRESPAADGSFYCLIHGRLHIPPFDVCDITDDEEYAELVENGEPIDE